MYTDISTLCVTWGTNIRDAIAQMDVYGIGIVLVVDQERRLQGTITDGDVRRAVLADMDLDLPVDTLLARKASSTNLQPITAPVDADQSTLLQTLQQHSIRHLPLVDQDHRVAALVTLDEYVPEEELPLQAVIMAGGLGTRLRPLTDQLPKPMLPVGDRPLMEIIIQQLRDANIKHVNVAVHHESDKITDHFGDGRDFGVEIVYVTEDRPLGTAGALGLMESQQETLLVINGDVLTQIDFRAMVAYHREHGAGLTVAVHRYDLQVPYGVIECEGPQVRRLAEKPEFKFLVNAGIYLLEPAAYNFIPNGQRYDMTDLIQHLLDQGQPVFAFPIREYWMDIGQHADLQQAQMQVKSWKSVQ